MAGPSAWTTRTVSTVVCLFSWHLQLTFCGRTGSAPRDVCQNEVFEAACAPNEIIVMETARYGRMEFSRCVERDYGYVGCDNDVLGRADTFCSGHRKCQISIPNSLFDETKPCPNDLKAYLKADYKCVKVSSAGVPFCRSASHIKLSAPVGLLASSVTETTGRGSAKCPWQLTARPGQRLNITLWDFGVSSDGPGVCHAYAIIREKTRSVTVCSGAERVRHVFTSISNSVEIRVMRAVIKTSASAQAQPERQFVLRYEAIGCTEPTPPDGGWVKRQGTDASVGCGATSGTSPRWRLVCDGNQWKGPVGNCTGRGAGGVFGEITWGTSGLPFGSSLIVIIVIAVALGVLILLSGLLILRCRRKSAASRSRQRENVYQTTYKTAKGAFVGGSASPQLDHELMYQVPENEYAYISDILPQDGNFAATQAQNLSNRHMELYKARKCLDYGTTRANGSSKQPPGAATVATNGKPCSVGRCISGAKSTNPRESRGPEEQARYVENGDPPLVGCEPPAYYELDPDGEPRTSSDKALSRGANSFSAIGPSQNGANAMGTNASGPPGRDDDAQVWRGGNQSIHEFTCAYDHLVDRQGTNTNHKSV